MHAEDLEYSTYVCTYVHTSNFCEVYFKICTCVRGRKESDVVVICYCIEVAPSKIIIFSGKCERRIIECEVIFID